MLGRLSRVGGTARRGALSSFLAPRIDATPAAAEKKPEELTSSHRRAALSVGSAFSSRLDAIPAAAEKKPEELTSNHRRAALSLGSALFPRLDATPAAAAEKNPEELTSNNRGAAISVGSALSPRLSATPAAAVRRTLFAEAEKKPEQVTPNQRRAALSFATSLSPLFAATPAAAAAAARRTLYTEREMPEDLTPNQIWLYSEITRVASASAKELDELRRKILRITMDFDDAVAAHRRAVAEAEAAARLEIAKRVVGAGLLMAMMLLVLA